MAVILPMLHERSAACAVLWDMDGTLIDSEDLHWHSWRETMASEGITITHDQFLASFGQRNDSIIPAWLGAKISTERIRTIETAKEEMFRLLVRERGVSPLRGVAEWIHRLKESGWLQAIASSAPRQNVETVVNALGIAGYFQILVSAEDVSRGKPDPEVFLLAASRLGVPPERCIVIEDAAAGIEGARRAGMWSIAVSRSNPPLAADISVNSLDLLEPDGLGTLLQRKR